MAEHFAGNGSPEAFRRFEEAVSDMRTVVSMDAAFMLAQF
jgi:hypothetical protein